LESEFGWRFLDFIITGIKRKGKKEYSKNILEFEYLDIFGKSNVFLSGVPGIISGLFLGKGLC
jgi:hypothetical protein